MAYALRKLDRTEEARNVLLPVADKFTGEWRVSYLLACYCSNLGDLKSAMDWLEKAIDVTGKADIRLKALDEPDLESLWMDIGEV